MPTTIDTDMSRGANVPKMTKEFVASEILAAIREERHDPPIGDEAKGLCEEMAKDPLAVEKRLRITGLSQDNDRIKRYREEFPLWLRAFICSATASARCRVPCANR